jgi:hypothetical protein
MEQLHYPFWIVTHKHDTVRLPVVPAERPSYIVAFTTLQKATDYMGAVGEADWELQMVSRPTFDPMTEHYRQMGLLGFCLDPSMTAYGRTIDFTELN